MKALGQAVVSAELADYHVVYFTSKSWLFAGQHTSNQSAQPHHLLSDRVMATTSPTDEPVLQ